MQHTLAYLKDDVIKEKNRFDYLFSIVRSHAPHLINDIERELKDKYPPARAFSYPEEFED